VDDTAQDEWLAAISAAAAVYAAMLCATVAGQLGGIGISALIGAHHLWIPLSCSVLLEALAGARAGALRSRRALTPRESARVSVTYSIGLALVSVPLALWIVASHPAGGALAGVTLRRVALGLAVLILGTGVRWALMLGFAPGRR
jgi:hypothetical protein